MAALGVVIIDDGVIMDDHVDETLSVSANWRAAMCFEICASLARRTSSI